MLHTTIAGSLPKPSWLAEPEKLWAAWRVPPESLAQAQRDAVLVALREQETAGIDVVTDGEQSRQHFVHGFLERLEGIDFGKRVTIGIRADRYQDDVAAWGIEALDRATEGLTCTTAVHICYGYGIQANVDWKKTLGAEWRQYERTFPLLARSRIDQVSLECANSRVPLQLLELLRGKDVMAGVIDV